MKQNGRGRKRREKNAECYGVVRLALEGSKVVKQEVFAAGWLQGEQAWGRPVEVETMADSLLVSDDQAGATYRITYRSP